MQTPDENLISLSDLLIEIERGDAFIGSISAFRAEYAPAATAADVRRWCEDNSYEVRFSRLENVIDL